MLVTGLKHCSITILVLLLWGCINNPEFSSLGNEKAEKPAVVETPPKHYKVKRGDTLYSIAWRFNLDYRGLASTNNIKPPYTIRPGQQLSLDVTEKKAQPPTMLPSGSTNNVLDKTNTNIVNSGNSQKNDANKPSQEFVETQQLRWSWPHNGKIVRTFGENGSLSKGVDIAGALGESVMAAATGKVVFAGNGLRGYGNLIIIEHNDQYLSAYGFNRKILVEEKQVVNRGEKIAELGVEGSSGDPLLHFEIRKDGKPVDPVNYLPRR